MTTVQTHPHRHSASTISQIDDAFATARRIQPDWAATSTRHRARIIARFARLVLTHEKELLDLLQDETGKARRDAFEEFIDVVMWASHVARVGPALLQPTQLRGAIPLLTRTTKVLVPKGVVGVITPWNYPFTLPVTDAIPALLAGNAVVLKPDALTPLIAIRSLELLVEAGLPECVMQIVHGPGAEVGSAVVARADFVMFTGSSAAGKTIAARCAERSIGFSAELGGKNAMLILEDAELPRAVDNAVHASFSNAGQLCLSMERIYVHSRHWDAFCDAFTQRVEEMRLGGGHDWEFDMGRLVSEKQLATVEQHVADAVEKGARILTGGKVRHDLGPLFFEPTVLTNVRPGMTLHREETFGPVVSLYRVEHDEDAIRDANDSDYGLNASVWSRKRGPWAAKQLRAGTVNINEGYAATWGSYRAPMGGMKQSGLGRRHGTEGIVKYTDSQTISQQHLVAITGPVRYGHERWASLMSTGARILRHFT